MPTFWQAVMQYAKRAIFRLPIVRNLMLPRYPFMLEPDQLIWLCDAIDRTRASGGIGCIVEVGVARGQTSAFLLTHMCHRGDSRRYYCIDTFQGFMPADVAHEISNRGKGSLSFGGFAVNDRGLVEQNLQRQGFGNAAVIQSDAGAFDWSSLPPIDVMLIDVDLYRPTKAVLANSQPHGSPFARVMVDDVKTGTVYDGAEQAYAEFCKERGFPLRPVGGKAGVIVAGEAIQDAARGTLGIAPHSQSTAMR